MIETSVVSSVLNSFMVDYRRERLPYGDWLPYDYSNKWVFRVSYVYKVTSMITCTFVHVAADALLCGLFIHVCCQIEILESRIRRIAKGQRDLLRKCARHHDNIYR